MTSAGIDCGGGGPARAHRRTARINATREPTRHRLPALLALILLAATAAAEETTSDWLKKILDPATIDVKPFPGSSLNRKLSVDTIRYDRDAPPTKRTAVYTAPLDQLDAAGKHFEATLATKPVVDTDPKGNKRYTFTLDGPGSYPPKAKGLKITIVKSPWVDNMVQIDMVWQPPG